MHSLPLFFPLAGRRVLVVGDGEAAAAKARLVRAAGAEVVAELPAVLAFVAVDDAEQAAAEVARLRAAGCLVNVVDRPALCDFTVPAIVDRSPVVVAVGTGGASASLAKALRERLEALLPADLGRLAEAIFAARAAVAEIAPTPAARRALWDAALAPGGPLDPLAEHADATAVIAQVLASSAATEADSAFDSARGGGGRAGVQPSATLTTIRLTSPDADELTLRQLRALAQADTIYHDAAVPATILDRARRDAVRVVGAPPAVLPPGRAVALGSSVWRPLSSPTGDVQLAHFRHPGEGRDP
ncbi:MAG: siroheme synthase [Sphingomonadaceae bacterium]|nr:siroheme synthase [Sphingomonadaceae bacterium]